jgi:hypothetical protein
MKVKRIMSIIITSVLLLNMTMSGSDYLNASAMTVNTTVNGSIAASIINVSVPASLAFTIDPNNPAGDYASEALIQNNTNAPIEVSISGGGDSFRQATDSPWKPVDYLPDELDWNNLGKVTSESALALGLTAKDALQWRILQMTDILWVKELAGITGRAIIGELDPNSSAQITFLFMHGNAFSEPKSCAYNITWSFSLAE